LTLITQALSKLGIDLSTLSIFQDPVPSQDSPIIQNTTSAPIPHPVTRGSEDFEIDGGFQIPPLDSFDLDGFEISAEMLDAFSTLEPIDATVGALFDFD
jgi:hypothetical protein